MGSSFSWCTAVAWTSIFNSLAGSTAVPTAAGAEATVVDSSEGTLPSPDWLLLVVFFSEAIRCFFSSMRSRSRSKMEKNYRVIYEVLARYDNITSSTILILVLNMPLNECSAR